MTSFKIGNLTLANQVVLAPMAGITNCVYRNIAQEMGVALCFTEMISAEALIRDNSKTLKMIDIIDKEKMVGVQLFGSNAQSISQAAKIVENKFPNVKLIDINMGCPVPKVAIKANCGSALLKDEKKIYEIVNLTAKSIKLPLTVKIRSGWEQNSINAVKVAKICEKAGASAISVHARTRAQGYSGKADWNIIKQVKEAVSIPVIGNGDVTSCYLAKKMLEQTGCDAVMLARATIGNPWLIKECVEYLDDDIQPQIISYRQKIEMMKKHYALLNKNFNDNYANLEIRKYILYYLRGMPNSKEIKNLICKANNSQEIIQIINEYEKSLINNQKT